MPKTHQQKRSEAEERQMWARTCARLRQMHSCVELASQGVAPQTIAEDFYWPEDSVRHLLWVYQSTPVEILNELVSQVNARGYVIEEFK